MAAALRDGHTSSGPYSPLLKSSMLLPWDRFSNWVHCICVVTFDLELGQAMELSYPSHIKLTDKEKTNICYLAFPDSNSGCMGDTKFNFRIRQCKISHRKLHTLLPSDKNSPVHLQSDPGYFNGFVFFRQVRDKASRRGYFQKSLVLITQLPYINLFSYLVGIIAPEFFNNGEPTLEAACHDIDQWPTPLAGETLHLPLMGNVLQVRIPARQDTPGTQGIKVPFLSPGSMPPIILPTVHEIETFRCFQTILPHIQLLWELVLTGEPLVVMASSPELSSTCIHCLVAMISPLKYMPDYRPYFTIHDSEFKEYTTKTQAPPSVILGVTNPFFAKTLQHWPHIVRLEDSDKDSNSQVLKSKKGINSTIRVFESKPGVYTRYKPLLNKDKSILKRLAKGVQTKRPLEVQDAMLRRYFLELTQSFIIPLERYVASLMPLRKSISPFKQPPGLRNFDIEEFLSTLENSGPQLTSGLKGDWIGLYRKFFKSSNFDGWFKHRRKEVKHKILALHIESMCEADLLKWIKNKHEVEVVDLILKLRENLLLAQEYHLPVKPEILEQLQQHIEHIVATLPEDLQSILLKS